MGHRQLALTFAALTAIFILAFVALRFTIHVPTPISMIVMILIYCASSLSLILIAKNKWELGYVNALTMLVSSSVVSALLIAFGYRYLQRAFDVEWSESFGALFIMNLFVRIPIDAIAALFRKRKA
jgi:hypothetical protein